MKNPIVLKKEYFFFLIYILISSDLYAQYNQNIYRTLNEIVPASPTSASFARYGEYPVSFFTGVMDISIPIYEIKTKNFTVPINLKYHASGIKVTDRSSDVGLGWTLDAGGRLSRFVKGVDDLYGLGSRFVRDAAYLNTSNNTDYGYIESIANQGYDGEPDIFSYNFLNYSGKFIFDNTQTPLFIPYAPLKIKNKNTFNEIINEKGDIFKFGCVDSPNTTWPSKSGVTPVSGFLLTSMKDKNSTDSVNFAYQSTGSGNFSEEMVDVVTFIDHYYKPTGAQCSFSDNSFGSPYSYNIITYGVENVLQQITFEGGKILFTLSGTNRQDMAGSFKTLSKIEIYNNISSSPQKTIQLYQSYFVNESGHKRLKLDSLHIKDSSLKIIERYNFDYNTQVKLPDYASKKRDYWGYYNNKNNTSLIPKMQLDVMTNGYPPQQRVTIGSTIENGFEPDPSYNQAYMLKRIYYPTGGYSDFTFESNQYLDNNSLVKYGGGVRIKEIISSDGLGNIVKKKYKYGSNENGNGRLNVFLANHFYKTPPYFLYCKNPFASNPYYECSANSWYVSSQPQNNIYATENAPVVYAMVDELIERGDTLERVSYSYSDVADYLTSYTGVDKSIIVDNSYKRGLLQSKTISYTIGGITKLVSKMINSYTYFPEISDYSLAIKAVRKKEYLCGRSDADRDEYSYFNYTINYGDNLLINTKEYVYDIDNNSKYNLTQTSYEYNSKDYCQVSKVTVSDSINVIQSKKYKYPSDYNYINPIGPLTDQKIFSEMKDKNIISAVIEEQTLRRIGTVDKLTGGIINIYKKENGLILPSELYSLELSQPSTNTTLSSVNSSGLLVFHPDYLKKVTFDRYDLRGNILQYHLSDNVNVSFMWGYNSTVPVVKAVNINYDALKSAVESAAGTSNLGTFWAGFNSIATNTSQQTIWKNFNESLRSNSSLSYVQLLTFTYLPLIGITSQTNISGSATYFEYDAFGRIKNIKNRDNKILMQNNYHFKKE